MHDQTTPPEDISPQILLEDLPWLNRTAVTPVKETKDGEETDQCQTPMSCVPCSLLPFSRLPDKMKVRGTVTFGLSGA
jgi:hypothetical protein